MFNTSTRAPTRTHTHTHTLQTSGFPKHAELSKKLNKKQKLFSVADKAERGCKGCTIINLHEWVMNRVYFLQLKYNLTHAHAHTQVYAMNNC